MSWPETLFFGVGALILGFYILLYAFYTFLLLTSVYGAREQQRRARLMVPKLWMNSRATQPVAILVPAHNEQASIVETVVALLGLRYPKLEVIVINDGSTDETLGELIRSFALRRADVVYNPLLPTERIRGIYISTVERRLTVIDKLAGGKSDALNAGLNVCRTPWVCTVDADSILEEDALLRAMQPAFEDDTVVATSGIVRIANGCRVAGGRVLRVGLASERLAVFQVVEYLRGFLQGRMGWSWLNGLLIISGAFGIFRADVLRAAGGYSRETVGEDVEVVLRIHRYCRQRRFPYRVVFVAEPVCWTEVPTRVAVLRRQRRRWQRGLSEIVSLHKNLFFRPGMGIVGNLALPYFALELASPMVEIFGYLFILMGWLLGWANQDFLLLYLFLAFLLGMLFTLWAVLIEEISYRRYPSLGHLLRLIGYAVIEHLGFHQLVLWSRLEGLFDYWRGRREWGEQVRTGFRHRLPSKV